MAYYKQWNSIVNKVFELIRNNDKLLRYISNAAPNPYDEVASSWSDIYLKNVFPMPREADSVGDQKTFVNVYMGYSIRTFLKTSFILKSVAILTAGLWKMVKFVRIPYAV